MASHFTDMIFSFMKIIVDYSGLLQKSWQLIFLGKHVTVKKVQNILMKGHDIHLQLA
jgi:hypothetical protein